MPDRPLPKPMMSRCTDTAGIYRRHQAPVSFNLTAYLFPGPCQCFRWVFTFCWIHRPCGCQFKTMLWLSASDRRSIKFSKWSTPERNRPSYHKQTVGGKWRKSKLLMSWWVAKQDKQPKLNLVNDPFNCIKLSWLHQRSQYPILWLIMVVNYKHGHQSCYM